MKDSGTEKFSLWAGFLRSIFGCPLCMEGDVYCFAFVLNMEYIKSFLKKGGDAWVAQEVEHLPLAQGVILGSLD